MTTQSLKERMSIITDAEEEGGDGCIRRLGQISRNDVGRHPDRGSGLGLRRAVGAFLTEHERANGAIHRGRPAASPG